MSGAGGKSPGPCGLIQIKPGPKISAAAGGWLAEWGRVAWVLGMSVRAGTDETRLGAHPDAGGFARKAFQTAWGFWVIAGVLGVLLRWMAVRPIDGLNYAYLTHAHSHVAFLGWVFSAFFALALRFFVPEGDRAGYWRLFLCAQVATAGMLIAYPIQGYGAASIAFSTLHMLCSGVFAWRLWRRSRASLVARGYLRTALGFMVISGLGPLALGPLAAAGLRETPWYPLSVYFYLHCQYNGWFVFFLVAVLSQYRHERGLPVHTIAARRSLGWLAGGCVLTFALSVLWINPPGWVYAIAVGGGLVQMVGCGYLLGTLRGAADLFVGERRRLVRGLAILALVAFLVKVVLQFTASWPGLEVFAVYRPAVIGFLHLVFLGVVTPMLIGWAVELGWLRVRAVGKAGLGLYLAGALLTEGALGAVSVAQGAGNLVRWAPGLLLLAAVAMVAGAVLLAVGLFQKRVDDVATVIPRSGSRPSRVVRARED